jgi:hypothetical protein
MRAEAGPAAGVAHDRSGVDKNLEDSFPQGFSVHLP